MTLSAGFIAGADVSSVVALERSGVVFRDAAGSPRDLFELLAGSGFTDVRVRVWNDPFDAQGRGYGGGTVDATRAVEIGRRATRAGLRVLVDFHYSDFWADPEKQFAPKAWVGLDLDAKAAALADFTRTTLARFIATGVDVRMVQVGNETNDALAGETEWPAIARLLNAGAAAVREVLPDALVAVHFANPETPGRYERYARMLADHAVDYDVFATSYYPFWHGTLENLVARLEHVATTYGKKVVVAETAWPHTTGDGDGQPNLPFPDDAEVRYPVGIVGQQAAMRDIVAAMGGLGDAGLGVYYWEPAWVPVGRDLDLEARRALWEREGSGWATPAAGGYLAAAVEGHGGSEWDNQTLFDFDGRALPSLGVFAALTHSSDDRKEWQ
jgi:arabinogalactan endo-1,4-beta-galactosidase